MSQELLIYLKQAQIHSASAEWAKAGDFYLKALSLSPNNPDILNDLGLVFKNLGGISQALQCFRSALETIPGHKAAAANLGNLLAALGELEEAEGWLRIALSRDNPRSWSNLGALLQAKGELTQAFQCYERALKIQPAYAEILNNMGALRQVQGRAAQAMDYFRQAIKIKPDFIGAYRNLLLGALYDPELNLHNHKDLYQNFAAHFKPPKQIYSPQLNKRKKIRLGYVSSDFRNHPVARNLELVFEHRDKEKFEVYSYADIEIPTAETLKFSQLSDQWRSIYRLTDHELAAQIYQDEIDILIILAGRFDRNRPQIALFRPASIIVSFHEVATLGLKEIDYLLTDLTLAPAKTNEYFAERPVHLPWFYIHKPIENKPAPGALPYCKNLFVTFGSFNNPAKLNDRVVELWSKLLTQIPNSKLLLKYKNCFKDQDLQQRIKQIMGQNWERVILKHSEDDLKNHLELYQQMDIALDCFPFSGSTTSFEALSMGIPVITWAGENMVGRWTASILSALGRKEWIAYTPEEYLEIAIGLAKDPKELAKIRANLGQEVDNSRLCQGKRFTRHYERLLSKMITCRNYKLPLNIPPNSHF